MVGTVLLLSGKLCLTHPNRNQEKFPTVFSPLQKYFQWLKDILLQVKASFWRHHNLLHIFDALPEAYSRLDNESTTLWTRAPRHTQKHAVYPLFITTAEHHSTSKEQLCCIHVNCFITVYSNRCA